MSCWSRIRCKIKIKNDASRALLRKALEVIAKKLNSEVKENFLVVGYSNQWRCHFAIPKRLAFGNAIGVYIKKDGSIMLVGDFHGAFNLVRRVKRDLERTYMALAIIQSAQQLGWMVNNVNEVTEGIVIDLGVRR